jgi:hypothetical protein
MKHVLRGASLVALCSLHLVPAMAAAELDHDSRAPFDKSAHLKTVWSAANPWFPPNLSRTHQLTGGPDYSWWKLSEDPVVMWQQVAELAKPYGLTGIQMEISGDRSSLHWQAVFQAAMEGFAAAGNDFKIMPFFSGTTESDVDSTVSCLRRLLQLMGNHPNVYRVDGHEVLTFYRPTYLTPEQWHEVFGTIEAEFGRKIWLFNAWTVVPRELPAAEADRKQYRDLFRRYLYAFDGISAYTSFSEAQQAEVTAEIAGLMREFPAKIFENVLEQSYLVHFHYGGVEPNLTEKYRNSWRIALGAKPDSVTVVNFFDIYEYTRIFPSYENEDILLKIAQFEITRWRGQEYPAGDTPDLYVTNPTSVRLGTPINLEVLGFPISGAEKTVTVGLDVCDERAQVLHRFEDREVRLDEMRVERYQVDSEQFPEQRAVYPRLRYRWSGRDYESTLFPQTNLVTALRPHMHYWARSIRRMIKVDHPGAWTLDGKGPGQTVTMDPGGLAIIDSRIIPVDWEAKPVPNHQQEVFSRHGGAGLVRLLRNGREIESFSTERTANWHLNLTKTFFPPNPGGALDWYNLELENAYGAYGTRYLTPSIWMVSGQRTGKVILPILTAAGAVKEVEVEAVRVPYFYYPCDRDAGRLLLDASGYEHHGYLGGEGYGGGHLDHTAYRHEHKPLLGVEPLTAPSEKVPVFTKDATGTGYLAFGGRAYVMIQGGTTFPYAYTYEMSIRPTALGQRQGLLGAANGSINLYLAADGTIEATRGKYTDVSSRVQSTDRATAGQWHRLAVVCDLRELTLYLDGKKQAAAAVVPQDGLEWYTAVVLGGTCRDYADPQPAFTGDLRQVRFYGRNLQPAEFLDAPAGTP